MLAIRLGSFALFIIIQVFFGEYVRSLPPKPATTRRESQENWHLQNETRQRRDRRRRRVVFSISIAG
jgi:hypothetical protein